MYLLNRFKFVFIFALASCSKYEKLNKRINILEEKVFFDSREFREEISLLNMKYNTSFEQSKDDPEVKEEENPDDVQHNIVLIKKALSDEKAFTRRSIDTCAAAMNNFNHIMNMFKDIKTEMKEIKDMQETYDKRVEQILDQQERERRKIVVLNDNLDEVTAEAKRTFEQISRHTDVQESISKSLWHVFKKSFYFIGRESITWKEAVETCKTLNSYLIEIGDSVENDYLINLANSTFAEYRGYGIWIGGSDLQEDGSWMWEHSKSKMTYFNWGTNEPNGKRSENCLHIYKQQNWSWNDLNCSRTMAYICERDF